jgi:hypothetical protein
MKRLLVPCLIGLLTLCGCARSYVMRLNNGHQITTVGKPKHQGNSFYYKDAKGDTHRISDGSVREIEPASMAEKDDGNFIDQPNAR